MKYHPKNSVDQSNLDKAELFNLKDHQELNQVNENSLTNNPYTNSKIDFEISPFVKSLSTGISIPLDFDYKKNYIDYLDEKHK